MDDAGIQSIVACSHHHSLCCGLSPVIWGGIGIADKSPVFCQRPICGYLTESVDAGEVDEPPDACIKSGLAHGTRSSDVDALHQCLVHTLHRDEGCSMEDHVDILHVGPHGTGIVQVASYQFDI